MRGLLETRDVLHADVAICLVWEARFTVAALAWSDFVKSLVPPQG